MKKYEYRLLTWHGYWFDRGPFKSLRHAYKERALVKSIHGPNVEIRVQRREIVEWEDFD